MEKTTAREKFGEEVKNMRKTLFPNKNQSIFANKINSEINSAEYCLTQKKVSDIERGNTIEIPESFIIKFVDVSKKLGYEFNECVFRELLSEIRSTKNSKKTEKTLINISEHQNLFTKPNQKIFDTYIGKYNCIFHSTDSSDIKYIKGIMEIKVDDINQQCKVDFSIIENEIVIKSYEGVFLFNSHYNMWYCILVGKSKQEICMIAAQHFNSTIRNNLFNIALVITTAAGVRKRPTMHRMFISREDIDEKRIELILPQLKLNDDTIFISENNIEALKFDLCKKVKDTDNEEQKQYCNIVLRCIEEIQKYPCEKYYRIDEALIYDTNIIANDKKILSRAISEIRRYTDNKYYNKLSETIHEICTQIMKLEL